MMMMTILHIYGEQGLQYILYHKQSKKDLLINQHFANNDIIDFNNKTNTQTCDNEEILSTNDLINHDLNNYNIKPNLSNFDHNTLNNETEDNEFVTVLEFKRIDYSIGHILPNNGDFITNIS